MRKHLLAFLLLSLTLVACGGESNEDKVVKAIETEDRIVEVVETALVKTDPASCTELKTQAFNEQSFRIEGAEAVETCEQNARAEESPNDPVDVEIVNVDGSQATVEVKTADTEPLRMSLVEEDGDWKLDELVRFASFDRGRWLKGQREALESSHSAPERQVIDCFISAYGKMSRAEIEEMSLGGSAEPEIEIIEGCNP